MRQTIENFAKSQPTGRNKRTLWSIPTKPFTGAHFATFPPALVEPCLLAGTSGGGCCATCGAPRVRLVTRERVPDRPNRVQGRDGDRIVHGADGRLANRYSLAVATVGWQAGCACQTTETVPAVLLDPFVGAGTSALVARTHGRCAVGIELNPDYLAIAKDRLWPCPKVAATA